MSVGIANVLLWCFTEVGVVLLTFAVTRQISSYLLTRKLNSGKKVKLSSKLGFIDRLPYNGDLRASDNAVKLCFTILRLGAIAASVYIGADLDGAVQNGHDRFTVTKSIDIAPTGGYALSENTGNDIAAMAKLSCLRILNNNDVVLYKGYILLDEEILCEDGLVTVSEKVLVAAQIRPSPTPPKRGIPMNGLNLYNATDVYGNKVQGLQVASRSITYQSQLVRDYVSIVLLNKTNDGLCRFGLHRSTGSGFASSVHLVLTTNCSLRVVDFSRLIHEKPDYMPPRMAFLYHFLDAVVVSTDKTNVPDRKGTNVVASISLAALCVAISIATMSLATMAVLRCATGRRVMVDLTSAEGVASVWHFEKYGKPTSTTSMDFYIVLDEQTRSPSLLSMDTIPENVESRLKSMTDANSEIEFRDQEVHEIRE